MNTNTTAPIAPDPSTRHGRRRGTPRRHLRLSTVLGTAVALITATNEIIKIIDRILGWID